MVYSISYINNLYNQLNLNTEVLDASFIVGEDLDNLTQFIFNRTPTFGVSFQQLEDLGYNSKPVLRSDLDFSYNKFLDIINQFIYENYGKTPLTSINFYPFSKEQNLDGVQKKLSMNYIFKKNIKRTILEKFEQDINNKDSETLAKMVLLLYKTNEDLEVKDDLGIKRVRRFYYDEEFEELVEPTETSLTEPTVTDDPLQ